MNTLQWVSAQQCSKELSENLLWKRINLVYLVNKVLNYFITVMDQTAWSYDTSTFPKHTVWIVNSTVNHAAVH